MLVVYLKLVRARMGESGAGCRCSFEEESHDQYSGLSFWFSGQCWDQGWCKGDSLLERRKGRNRLFSPACGWEEEEDGAVTVIGTALTSPGCGESPWGWHVCVCVYVQEDGDGRGMNGQLGLAVPHVSSLCCF